MFREPQTFLMYWGTMKKNVRLKVSFKWFLRSGPVLYDIEIPVNYWQKRCSMSALIFVPPNILSSTFGLL